MMMTTFKRVLVGLSIGGLFASPAQAGPGSGTASISPSASVVAGSTGKWSIVYTAAEVMKAGTVRLTIPTGWSAPQTSSSTSEGFITVSTDEPTGNPSLSVGGQVIVIAVDTLSVGNVLTLVYGDDAAGANPGARANAATTTGSYSFLVESDPAGASVSPIASSPALTVIPSPTSSLDPTPNDTTVTAGAFVPYRILVLDAYGNRAPVPVNRTVGLFATNGFYYLPADHSTPIASIVIPSGQSSVRVDYRSTLATGGSSHTLTMFTQSGSPGLGGVEFVQVNPAALSTTISTISATSPVTANGTSQSSVTVTSKDAFGNPRAGDTVVLAVTGNANKVDPGSTTAADGRALGSVTNLTAQVVTVSATINAQALTPTASVTFVPGPVSAATSIVNATTPVVANGIATSTVSVTARDANNNPIAGQSVTLSVIPSAGATLTQPGGVTNSSGIATGGLASTVAGLRTVKAVIGATSVADSAIVTFTPGAVASFQWSVDGSAVAGVSETVTLTAKDAQGNVVTNYTGTVNLSTTSGGVGDGVVEWAAPGAQGILVNQTGDDATYQFAAGDNGVAPLRVTDTRAESFQLIAQAGAPSGTSAAINVVHSTADKVQLVAGNGQTATVNTAVGTLPRVKVTDAFDNPVGTHTVTFRLISGGGFVDVVSGGGVDSTGTTAGDGTIDCDVWRLGTTAGLNRLRALIASGSTQSVDFTATGTAGQGANLVLAPASKSVTVNSFEVVTASLTDAFGNAKSGERVDVFIKDAADGQLVSNPADPNPTTAINTTARFGTSDAAGHITLRYQAPAGAGLADVIDAFTSNVAQGSVTDATYTTTASGATNLRITFVGSSTKPAGQSAQFTVEAVDGTGNVDTGNSAVVTLAPEAGSGLLFSLTDFGGTVTQVTLASGARTVYARGTLAGDWDITTSGGGLGADTDVMTVTDAGVIDHYAVSTVANTTAGVTFNVAIEARDVYNNRVIGAGNAVTLAAIDDINPGPAQSTLLVTGATLAAGQANVGDSYTKAEAIRVKVTDAGAKQGISGILTVAADAAKRIAKVSGDATGIGAGAGQVLTARVLDQFDNPVTNETVSFIVVQGGGSVLPPSIASSPSGNAATTLTTGAVAGDNRVRATILDGSPPSDELVEFSVQTVAGGIAYFTVVPQKTSLTAGEVVPLTITAFDSGNNVVTQDNTTSIQLSSTGDAQFGSATGTLTSGVFATTVRDTLVQTFTITAQKSGGGPPSGTSALVTVTNAPTYRVVKISGDASGITSGGTQALQVEVRDQYGNPVPGALATFSIANAPDGTGFFQDTDGDPNDGIVVTNGSGRGTVTYHTAQTAGSNQVNAQILDGSPAARERVTFTVNTIANGATSLRITFLGPSTVAAGQSFSFKVEALDASNNLDAGNTSLVTLTPEAASTLLFSLTDFGTTTTTFNLVGGTRTIYGRGTKAGDWDITAAAAGVSSDLDVVTITHTGVVASYAVASVDSAVAGTTFNVSIEARDAFANRVLSANNIVNLVAVDDVTPTPTGTSLSVTQATLVSGAVVVNESYTVAERMRVRARDAGSFEGYSNVTKIKPAAAYRVTNVGGDGSGIVAGATRVLTARVLDPFNNAVQGQLVSFAAIQGGGSPSPPSGTTNAAGDVTTTLTTGTTVGTNVARATILDGTPPALETADFTVSTIAGLIASYQVLPTKTSLVANEVTSVTIKAMDANGNFRVQDNTTIVAFSHTGNATLGNASGTLSGGQFVTTVRDTVAQTFTVGAQTQGGGPTGTSAVITVTNGPAYRVVEVSGSSPSVPVSAVQPLRTEVRDQWGNTVAGSTVTYLIQASPLPSSFLRDSVGDTTDGIAASLANGRAVARLHTSATAGLNTVTATILDGNPAARERVTFGVTTVAGGIDHYTVVMSASSTTAGVSKNAAVTAFDINNNLVDDDATQVTLAGNPGVGLVFGTNPLTLSNGVASTSVTANQVQTYQVRASTVGVPSVTGLSQAVTVVPAAPAGTITATATQTTITANGTSTTHITSGVINDAFGNQVAAGLSVNVSANNGGVIVGGSPKLIAADGRIQFDLQSSTNVGLATVTMTSATGTASGTIGITFAVPPALACNTAPTPGIVVPGEVVGFSVVVDNSTVTPANLTTATTFTFTDGPHVYSANLAAPQTVPGNASATLVFSSATVNASFTTATYAPTATLIGSDSHGAPVNVACQLPAASLLVTSIEITDIVPASGVVSRGQSTTVAVTVKNKGAQPTTINDVDLVFIPAGLFTVGTAPEFGLSLAPGASGVFNVAVDIQAGANVGPYDIDATATGTVGGKTVVDDAVAPHPRGQWVVQAAANLTYEPSTLTPTIVSKGKVYAFEATIRNSGGGLVLIDSMVTRFTFTDGVRTFGAAPTQPYAIAGGGAMQTMTFVPRTVPAAFTSGSYAVTLNTQGTENGAPFSQTVPLTGSPVSVVTPASVASAAGDALKPDRVSKTATAAFTVQLVNSGQATVNLTPATTTIRFAGGVYTAALSGSGPISLPPGTTTLQFLGAVVNPSISSTTHFPQVQLTGFENGLPFSQSITLTDGVIVENAPAIAILNMIPSQNPYTQDQAKPIKVRMLVANSGGANVTFTAASMRFIHAGQDRSNQFVISVPTTFSRGPLLSGGETDTVVFNVSDNTGNSMTVGNMTIEGALEVEDVNTSQPVFADTDLGGKGTLQVMSPATITLDAITPSQVEVTQSMGKTFQVRAAVRNTGGSELVLTLNNANTHPVFSPAVGWVSSVRPALAGGGATLSGGEVDTVIFDVTQTGSTVGATMLDARVAGTETNTGRAVVQQSSGLGSVLVQSPGVISITGVVPSRTTITSGAAVPWTITVSLTNTGQSDVDLDLGNAVGVAFGGASPLPGFVVPTTLAGGGVTLSGGETDQFVISVASAGTYTSPGGHSLTVDVDGTEKNSGATKSGSDAGTVLVQNAPDVAYVSLTPGVVSKGASVGFAVTITNPVASGATLTLDRSLSRLRFGAGAFDVGLSATSPVDVPAGSQVTVIFASAVIGAGIPAGPQGDAVLALRWTHNGATANKNVPIAGEIVVQNAPDLSIVSVRSSRATVTRQQAGPWTMTMVVRNAGQAAVDLDLAPASTRLLFTVLGSGANVTSEYTVAAPTALEFANGTVLAGGQTDSLIFNITQAGITTGAIVVGGFVRGTDLNSSEILTDDTSDGGSGSFQLQTQGVLNVLSITTPQVNATVAQTTKSYPVKMAVRNDGGAAINVSLLSANTFLSFPTTSGWVVSAPTMPSGVTLSGGETDTVRFTVTTTGGPAGVATIGGTVSGTENNTGAIRSDNTLSGGTGSILLQTPASLVVDSVTPSQATVTASTASGWDVTIALHNAGESTAQLNLPAGFSLTVQSSTGGTVFIKPVDLEEGGVLLPGGASGTLVAHTNSTGTFSSLGVKAINASIGAVETNSNRVFSTPGIGSITVQSAPNLTVVAIRPGTVTSDAVVDFEVDVANTGANTATAVLDRGATRIHFAGGLYSAFLKIGSPDSVLGGTTQTLSFEEKTVPVSITPGPYNFNADFAYSANEIDLNVSRVVTNGVVVQAAPELFIQQITTSQSFASAGQTAPWTATMTVHNTGSGQIDLDLAPAKTFLTFIAPGAQVDNSYIVSAPVMAGGDDILDPDEQDQIIFTVTKTGNLTGAVAINGRVEGLVNGTTTVTDNTFDGGRGSITIQPSAAIAVTSIHPSQPEVTAGQVAVWGVRVVLANSGGADVTINMATSTITFAGPPAGWTIGSPTLLGGGNVLEGGAVDSLLFPITSTGGAGTKRIDATVPWTEIFSSASGSANTTTSGFGQILVETPPRLQILTTTATAPNAPEVNVSQPFAVTLQITNTGQADARNVAVGLSSPGGSTIDPIVPIDEIVGGQTVSVPLGVTAAPAPAASEVFTSTLNSAIDENSAQSNLVTLLAPVDATANVAIQTPAVLDITAVRPSQPSVTRSQSNPWSVIVALRNTGQSDVNLTPPAAADVAFSLAGATKIDYVVQPPTTFGSGAAGWRLAGGAIDSLIYNVVVTGSDTGTVDIALAERGSDRNDPPVTLTDTGATTVRVQDVAGLAISSTVGALTFNHATANRDTVNTGFAYEIQVTVQNSGETVDSVLVALAKDGASTVAPASLRRQSIDVSDSHTFVYRITAPAAPSALETFTATILSGVVSHNSGQPVTPQPAVDNTHVVVTVRRADLVTALTTSAAGGVVSPNQVFTLTGRVTNVGQASLAGPASVTLTVPPGGFAVQEALVRPFSAGAAITWTVTAPATPQPAGDFACAITTTPNDANLNAAAFASKASDTESITVSTGGALANPGVSITNPAGAVDATVSVSQTFTVHAIVTATTTTGTVRATLSLPGGFSVVGNPVRTVGTGTGAGVPEFVDYSVIAPAIATAADDVFVTFTGIDTNSQSPVPPAADTVAVAVVPRAALSVSASVTAPPDAIDNTVGVGTPFTVTASVTNAAGAAGIGAGGTLSVALPAGFSLGGGETAAKPFVLGTPVSWVLNAPSQPSGPDQISIAILATPPDENSGAPALIVNGTATIAMVTEGSAVAVRDVSQSLGIATGVVPAGATDVALLGFEIAYNASDPSVNSAEIDTIAITVFGKNGQPLGASAVAGTLKRLSIALNGAQPYVIVDPTTNPIVVSLTSSGPIPSVAPNATVNAVVALDLDAQPRETEIRVGLRAGALVVRDPGSGQALGVTDAQGRPLDGQVVSRPLVVLSSNFSEYAHNYPNPFRAGSDTPTRIAYFLTTPADVSVKIYAMTGDLVFEKTINAGDTGAQAGPQEATWDGRNGKGEVVRNGVYVCVLNAGSNSAKFRIAVAK